MALIQGTAASEILHGTESSDRIYGLGGDDGLFGFAGDDVLDGGEGRDTMSGGLGNDRYVVDDLRDNIVESPGEGDDWLHAHDSYVLGAGVSVETMTTMNEHGTQGLNLTGNEFGQSIYGNAGTNLLNGGGGADYLVGLGGNDRYIVDNVADGIGELASQGDDTVHSSVSYVLGQGVSVETVTTTNEYSTAAIDLTGNEFGQSLYGNAGANTLFGDYGDDHLVGMDGDDRLIGSWGRDTMVGGTGADTFFAWHDAIDRIADFTSGSDKIDLGDFVTQATFQFIGSNEFSGTAAQGRYANGRFELDTNGDRLADLVIELTGPLAASDFSFGGSGMDPWGY